MPREIAHAFIATEAFLKVGPLNESIFPDNILRSAFILGTFSPDSGYYLKSTRFVGDQIADYIHGIDNANSFEHLHSLILNSEEKNKKLIEAFCLGVMSHILLDSFWHPLVFKLTGDYYHIDSKERAFSRARHRRLESLFDSTLVVKFGLGPKRYLINSDIQSSDAKEIAKTFTKASNFNGDLLLRAWNWHKNLQKIFTNKILSNSSSRLPIPLEFRALFSDFNMSNVDLIEELVFDNFAMTFSEWVNISIIRLSEYFHKYDTNKEEFFRSVKGPSANSGVIGSKYFSGVYAIDNRLLSGY